jgi:hypothetical protein
MERALREVFAEAEADAWIAYPDWLHAGTVRALERRGLIEWRANRSSAGSGRDDIRQVRLTDAGRDAARMLQEADDV